jgi:hypothetical protein
MQKIFPTVKFAAKPEDAPKPPEGGLTILAPILLWKYSPSNLDREVKFLILFRTRPRHPPGGLGVKQKDLEKSFCLIANTS